MCGGFSLDKDSLTDIEIETLVRTIGLHQKARIYFHLLNKDMSIQIIGKTTCLSNDITDEDREIILGICNKIPGADLDGDLYVIRMEDMFPVIYSCMQWGYVNLSPQ